MQEQTEKTCEHMDCKLPVNYPHDDSFCIFHAPKENKGIDVAEFNKLIVTEKIEKNDFNFWGYIFPGSISFHNIEFTNASFLEASFLDKVDFFGITFLGTVSFRSSRFIHEAYFSTAIFSGKADFYGATFSGKADFLGATFSGKADFWEANFFSKADFLGSTFSDMAHFSYVTFSGIADFRGAKFLGRTDFEKAYFEKNILFFNNIISRKLIFKNISLHEKSYFYLQNPSHQLCDGIDTRIVFEGIQFIPYRTYFENILSSECVNSDETMCVLFRYCQLEDVYFTKNNMSFFSFHKSNFDHARFISCNWGEDNDTVFLRPYKRKNIIFEEHLLLNIPEDEKEKKAYCERYQIDDLEMREVSSLYRRMKTALDRTKDYQESGWFYFNEFETKRRELPNSPKKCIYHLYKVFSGYGEKPFWSFFWLLLFSVVFSFIHLLSGINTSDGVINYDITLKWYAVKNLVTAEFWGDWLNAITFTFYRLIPVNYMPVTDNTITPIGLHGLFWALLNTFVLILMLTFIGIGLKRHFKRF